MLKRTFDKAKERTKKRLSSVRSSSDVRTSRRSSFTSPTASHQRRQLPANPKLRPTFDPVKKRRSSSFTSTPGRASIRFPALARKQSFGRISNVPEGHLADDETEDGGWASDDVPNRSAVPDLDDPATNKNPAFMVGAVVAKFKKIGKNNHRAWTRRRDEATAAAKAKVKQAKDARLSMFYEAQAEREESEIERRFNAARAERYRLQVAIALEAKIAMHGTEDVRALHNSSSGDDADVEDDYNWDADRAGGSGGPASVGGSTEVDTSNAKNFEPMGSGTSKYNPGEVYLRSEEEHYEMGLAILKLQDKLNFIAPGGQGAFNGHQRKLRIAGDRSDGAD
eukprot:gene18536-17500_t